jgi:hypothetical protein
LSKGYYKKKFAKLVSAIYGGAGFGAATEG